MKETATDGAAAAETTVAAAHDDSLDDAVSLYRAHQLTGHAISTLAQWAETGRLTVLHRRPRGTQGKRIVTYVSLSAAMAEPLHRPNEITVGEMPLSMQEAQRRSDLSLEQLLAAVRDGRLPASFGRDTTKLGKGGGRRGSATRWIILSDDLDVFVAGLPVCRYPGCERLGAGPTGCCSGAHAIGVQQAGRPRPPEVVAKMSASKKGRKYGPRDPAVGRAISASLRRFWDSPESAEARARLREAARRLRHPSFIRDTWTSHSREVHSGRLSKPLAAAKGKRVGRPGLDEATQQRVGELLGTMSDEAIAIRLGISRDQVKRVKRAIREGFRPGSLGETPNR
jgi:hypothetical protein